MADKDELRRLRAGTIINATSKQQEKEFVRALFRVVDHLLAVHPDDTFVHEPNWELIDIADGLRERFPDVAFHVHFPTSRLQPDAGIIFLADPSGTRYPVLIGEVKNQGTNHLRRAEGKKPQSRGNAIERLGKNVIGFRAALRHELIFPFVCFGYGSDFVPESSILDRVTTIAMYGELNRTCLENDGQGGVFNRGSFYFRPERWTEDEMYAVMVDIALRSVAYYRARYAEAFAAPPGAAPSG